MIKPCKAAQCYDPLKVLIHEIICGCYKMTRIHICGRCSDVGVECENCPLKYANKL